MFEKTSGNLERHLPSRFAAALLPRAAHAQITYDILSMVITNYTGFAIPADGPTNNASYNRESLLVDSDVRVGHPGGTTLTVSYYLSYRLLDAGGQPHPIDNAATGTQTNSGYTYNITNSTTLLPGNAFVHAHLGVHPPCTRLNSYTQYTVELRLFQNNGTATGETGPPMGRADTITSRIS